VTDTDPWHPRLCCICEKLFTPRTRSRKDAAKSKCCSPRCAAKRGAESARAQGVLVGNTEGSHCKPLSQLDETPCAVCSLRGHEPGDPVRCRQPLASTGLGVQSWA
jgi:hypothetical protein